MHEEWRAMQEQLRAKKKRGKKALDTGTSGTSKVLKAVRARKKARLNENVRTAKQADGTPRRRIVIKR